MQYIFNKTLLVSALTLAIAPAAYATNGLAPTGLGQIHKAMGGAAAGNPENTMTMATNPAAASFIEDGMDIGLELFVPVRETTTGGPFPVKRYTGNGTAAFAIPENGFKKTLSNGLSVGLTAYGNGGMNTDYGVSPFENFPMPHPPGNASGGIGIDFKQVFISPTISKKIGNNHSVAIAVNLVGQTFKSKGVVAPNTVGTDTATGIGATLGWMGKISPNVTVGLSHRLKTKMSKFKNHTGMFRTTGGKLDVPGATTLGISFNTSPKTKVAIDLQRIYYGKVKAIKDGFGWDDQDIIKLGVKHQLNNKVALMGGLNYGKSPVTSENVGHAILAPAVSEKHLSLGAEIKMNKHSSVSLSYVHAFENDVTNGAITTRMAQDAVGVGYSRTF
ncbi:MAG: hydrocarbon degradation protein [Cocleimonas sp.]|nr:hydrocarbon degradation protein [Cocleimonas sp.]